MAVGSQRRPCSASEKRRKSIHSIVDKPANEEEPSGTRELPSSPKLLLEHERTWASIDSLAVDRETETARRGSAGYASSQSGGHRVHSGGHKNGKDDHRKPGILPKLEPVS